MIFMPQQASKSGPSSAPNRSKNAIFGPFQRNLGQLGVPRPPQGPWKTKFRNFCNFSGPKLESKNGDFRIKKAF